MTYRLAKAFTQVQFISLVNLILDKEAVPECIQGVCTLRAHSSPAFRGLPEGRAQQHRDQTELRAILSKSGASQRVAETLLRPVRT